MDGSSVQKREGLQVVKVSQEPGRRWDLDEKALASVLLRPDIRNLPVVVVSVAGAYRGGKSFILDFFLRYLIAPYEHQSNGQWLGNDDDLLEGFKWRGGGESDTKGIYLWPEPFVVHNERTGRKVAVLLMDTQGTFDTESDMGDNSSVFALSVLLSSTQIYNLSKNIREDDLHHLQLFTEYGKIATKLKGAAFQTLLFLIRDWASPYERQYGYVGGQALMDARLKSKPNQKEQLSEVREHIHSCFEKLECFLMPYPGSGITNKDFKGRLGDIDPQFRLSLLELVPALFDQNNLTPKTINGEQVPAQGLYEYFKQYVGIFNSDELPEAVTIFQATVDAAITSALREARECYESTMKTKIIEGQSTLTSMIQTWHDTALEAAVAQFQEMKKFGSEKKIADHLADFKQTSDTWLTQYQLENNEKLRNALSEAKRTYEDTMETVCKDQALVCLHARDLEALHNRALTAALNSFDPTRTMVPQELDTDRNDFIKDVEQNYKRLCETNKLNNKNAVLEARELYIKLMKENTKNEAHQGSLKTSIEHFLSHRNQPTEETEDHDLDRLRQEIEVCYEEFKKANAQTNLLAMNAAESAYNNYMNSAMGLHCFHPRALRELHEVALAHSLEQFHKDRIETSEDDHEDRLIIDLEQNYKRICETNKQNNKNAKLEARELYTTLMKENTKKEVHEDSFKTAIDHFLSQRNPPTEEPEDHDLDLLRQEIEACYEEIRKANAQTNLLAMNAAESTYNNYMNSAMGSLCFHPRALRELHEEALTHSLEQLHNDRIETGEDNHEDKLIANLEQNYKRLCETNKLNNKNAKLEARELYIKLMKENTKKEVHQETFETAIGYFLSQRNPPTEEPEDHDLDLLRQEIEACYEEFRKANEQQNTLAMNAAESAYNNYMNSAMGLHCFHARALWKLHEVALALSLEQFHNDRIETDHDDFEDRLIAELQQHYQRSCIVNERNNRRAVVEALMLYMTHMRSKIKKHDHEQYLRTAIDHFLSHRNQTSVEPEDPDLDRLRQRTQIPQTEVSMLDETFAQHTHRNMAVISRSFNGNL